MQPLLLPQTLSHGWQEMIYEGLQLVIGLALVDERVRDSLLQDRRKALVGLPLTDEESAMLMAIEADSLAEIAERIEEFIESVQAISTLNHEPAIQQPSKVDAR